MAGDSGDSAKIKAGRGQSQIQSLIREKVKGILTEDQKRKLEEPSASTQAERRSGRIWLPSADGKAAPVPVVLGITDGSSARSFPVISMRDRGDRGETTKNNEASRGTPSPFGGGPGGLRK